MLLGVVNDVDDVLILAMYILFNIRDKYYNCDKITCRKELLRSSHSNVWV